MDQAIEEIMEEETMEKVMDVDQDMVIKEIMDVVAMEEMMIKTTVIDETPEVMMITIIVIEEIMEEEAMEKDMDVDQEKAIMVIMKIMGIEDVITLISVKNIVDQAQDMAQAQAQDMDQDQDQDQDQAQAQDMEILNFI
jgi:hypothetical protein